MSAQPIDPTPAILGSSPTGVTPGSGVSPTDDHFSIDTQGPAVVGGLFDTPAAVLRIAADTFDDVEKVRIATENRVRSLAQVYGVDADTAPEIAPTLTLLGGLTNLEHAAELNLKRTIRQHPLGPWIKATHGIGEKQGARLIAALADPYWNDLHQRPRTVSELWAFCGYHVLPAGHTSTDTQSPAAGGHPLHPDQGEPDNQSATVGVDPLSDPGQTGRETHSQVAGVAPSRKKGQRANWSAEAKMRAYLCAGQIVKTGIRQGDGVDDTDRYDVEHRTAISPLGQVYLNGRAKYADAVHPAECRRCGPKGKPAPTGSPLSRGHQEARALRLVSKEILKQLWLEAKRLHELHDGQRAVDTQRDAAVVDPLPTGQKLRDSHFSPAGGQLLHPDHRGTDSHIRCVGVDSPKAATS